MRSIFILILAVIMPGCTSDNDPLQAPDLSGKPEIIQLVKDNWPKLLAHCPGLNKYQNDLTFEDIEDSVDPVMEEMSRADVTFRIAKDPQIIPDSFRAWGHTCRYGISPDGMTLRIQKDVCVSICLDKHYQGPTDYLVSL